MGRGLLTMVPTRDRPDNAFRFLESWKANSTGSDLVFLNDYEASSFEGGYPGNYPGLPWDAFPDGRGVMWKNFGGDPTTTGKLNRCAAEAVKRGYDYLMFIGDDHVIETWEWHRVLIGELIARARGVGWAYPKDGRRDDVPEICLISSVIVEALGWFALPASRHGYIDHAWSDLAMDLDRLVFVPDVMIRHRHYRVYRDIERDKVYERGEAWASGDGEAYLNWRDGGQRYADVARIRSTGLFS